MRPARDTIFILINDSNLRNLIYIPFPNLYHLIKPELKLKSLENICSMVPLKKNIIYQIELCNICVRNVIFSYNKPGRRIIGCEWARN